MDFTVTATGPTLADLTGRSGRALRTANRKAGTEIAKAGRKAMNATAKSQGRRWYGKALRVKYKNVSSPTEAVVTFNPAKGQAGGWAIAEAGASGHDIFPRRKRGGRAGDRGVSIAGRGGRVHALHFSGLFSSNADHPGARGVGTWTKATKAVAKAVKPELEHVYQDALDG